MIRLTRAVALLACALAFAPGTRPGRLAAQRPEQGAVGFAVGLGWVPRAENGYCGRVDERNVRGVLAEGRLAVAMGHRFSIEGRLSAQSKVDLKSEVTIVIPIPDGTCEDREYHLRGDGFAGGDLRLRYDVPRVPLVLTGGVGQLWGLRAPYFVFGPGLRLGHRLRLVLDGDLIYAQVPFDHVQTVWRGGAQVDRLVLNPPDNEWRTLGGGRLGVELGLR